MYRQSYSTELQLEASNASGSRRKETAQILDGGAECLAALRMAESLSLGGAPGSRRLDLRHRRSHSNDQHLTVSASGSLSLHHHQPHGASIGYYISHHKHQDNNRTRAMHALELYVVTKQTRVHGTMDCCFT
jgi:hypothetical protein